MYITIDKKQYPVPAGSTAKETFESLQMVMPEIANAKLKKDGDNYKVEKKIARLG